MDSTIDNKKKMAAAMAAVSLYIKTEEEAMATISAGAVQPKTTASPGFWGMSGRQAMMQNRNLMQLRTFHGTRPR